MNSFTAFKRLLLYCIAAVISTAPTLVFSADESSIVLATGEWVPYSSASQDGSGLACEIVSSAFNAVGINAKFVFYPWKRVEESVSNGLVFAGFPYFILNERLARPDLFTHSDTLFSSEYGIVSYRRDENQKLLEYTKPEDLAGYTIGLLAGTPLVATPLKEANIEFEESNSIDSLLMKLSTGRLDFVIDDRLVLQQKISSLFPNETQKFLFLDASFSGKRSMHLLVSSKFPHSHQILSKFNRGLQIISENGVLQKLYEKYSIMGQ